MKPAVEIEFPVDPYPQLCEVFNSQERELLIETAPLTGVRDILLAWLFSEAWQCAALKTHRYIWITDNPTSAYHSFVTWASAAGLGESNGVSARSKSVIGIGSHELVFVNAKQLVAHHWDPVESIVMEDAHLLPHLGQWIAEHVHGLVRAFGRREGEFARLIGGIQSSDVVRIPLSDAVLGGWVNERRAADLKNEVDDATFDRIYELREPGTDGSTSWPITLFTKRRLWLRTDKPLDQLNKYQQDNVQDHEPDMGTSVVPFVATPLQRRYLAEKRLAVHKAKKAGRPNRVLLLKYRRGGFTTLEQAISYRTCVSRKLANVVTLAQDRETTERIFRMVKFFHQRDPKAPPLMGESKTYLEFAATGSRFFVGTAGTKSFARGDTLQRLHGSEVAHWKAGPNNLADMKALTNSFLPAASHGQVILETTANGMEWFAHTYREAKLGQNNWHPIFLPWMVDPLNRKAHGTYDPDEIKDTRTADEVGLVERTIKEYGIKVDDAMLAWRRIMMRELGVLFAQEYPEDDESCFLTSGTAYFDIALATRLLNGLDRSQIKRTEIPGGLQCIVEDPQEGVAYCAGADTSEGLANSDPCGLGIMEQKSGRQIAWIHGRWRPDVFAKLCVDLCKKYNNAVLGIERNNHGHAVLQKVREIGGGKYRRPTFEGGRLYFHRAPGRQRTRDGRKGAKPGWPTDPITRPLMISELFDWLNVEGVEHLAMDPTFLAECLTFKLQSDGKYAADPGCHDDAVIKWAIANQMRKEKTAKPRIF